MHIPPVTMSEEQQVAIEVQGVNPSGKIPLIAQTWLGKATRPQTPKHILLLLCLCMFAAVFFLWHIAWYE